MRKKGSYNISNYHYLVTEYDTWKKKNVVSKSFFRTQREIQSTYNLSRSCIYHTMHGNLERVKKYNYLQIERLTPPIRAKGKNDVIVYEYETATESDDDEMTDSDYDESLDSCSEKSDETDSCE